MLHQAVAAYLGRHINLDKLPGAKKEALLDQFAALVGQRVFFHIAKKLSETEKENFVSLLQKENEKEFKKFIQIHAIDFNSLVAEEAARTNKELLDFLNSKK